MKYKLQVVQFTLQDVKHRLQDVKQKTYQQYGKLCDKGNALRYGQRK